MPKQFPSGLETLILYLSKRGFSYREIIKECKKENFVVSRFFVYSVVNSKGKRRETNVSSLKDLSIKRARKTRNKELISKVKKEVKKSNPISQNSIANKLNTNQTAINRIIHKDLKMATWNKTTVNKITESDKVNRKRNCRKLYEKHLAGNKSEFVVTLDEAYIYLDNCNNESKICYMKRGELPPDDWILKSRALFPKGFMIVGILTGRGALPLIRVPNKVKVNSEFYVNYVLKPLFEKLLPKLYKNDMDQVFLHHDKATSHTSEFTTNHLKEISEKLGISFLGKEDIPIKSPDCSPLDFYGFGMLKQKLIHKRVKSLEGVWKHCKSIWSQISAAEVVKVFDSWKRRCRLIVKKNGSHIQRAKDMHKKKLSL